MDKNNFNVNGNLYGVGVAHDGAVVKQNIILPEHKVPQQLTSKLGQESIIGRKKELKEIDEFLNSSNSLLLINGIGGIGKSTIASYYLHSQKDKLDYYGFFEGVESFTSELREPLDLKQEKQQDAFMEALAKLRKLEGEKLLVIDDVKGIEENQEDIERILELKNSGYKILLTSREEIEDIELYYLDVLSMDDAKKLFNSIYEIENEVLLEEILEYLDCHTFFVEMTAKTLKSKKTLTPELIKEKFENGEFSTIKRKRKESFNDYLNELFSFDELDDEEILMLKQLSVLPSIEIEFTFLQEIFDKKDDEEFEELLNYLCDKGWLSSFENGYKLHQIVKEFLLLEENIISFEEIEAIVNELITLLKTSNAIEMVENNRENIIYFESLVGILDKLEIENKKIGTFFNNLGLTYHYLGFYPKAESLYIKSIKMLENFLEEEYYDIEISYTYNNLAELYRLMGVYSKSEPLYLKSLKVLKNILGEEHSVIATIYNNLGMIYYSMGLYRKAEPLYLEALRLREKLLGEEHFETTTSYNNLAEFYNHAMKEYKKAESFYLKSLRLKEKIFLEEHPDTATAYNNLAGLYESMKEYEKAEPLYLKALMLRENLLGEEHSDTATSYNDLGFLYHSMDKHKKAELLYLKALKLREKLLNKNHPDIAQSYNNLGGLYNLMGVYKKVEEFFLKALKLREETLGEEHPDTGISYNNLGTFYYEQGKYNKAYRYMKRAVDIWLKVWNDSHPTVVSGKAKLVIIEKMLPVVSLKKIKRNNPCPCNSGKKYKKCCGKNS